MAISSYLTAIFGSSLRLSCYIFLQVIPTRLARVVLPFLYTLHVLGLSFSVRQRHFCAQCRELDRSKLKGKSNPPTHHHSRWTDQFWSIFLCLPFPSQHINWINLAINSALLLAAAEFATTPFLDKARDVTFTRIGAVYSNGAKIVIRYPFSPAVNSSVNVLWREVSNGTHWQQGPRVVLSQDSDWVATVKIKNLWPRTSYEYILADSNQTILPYPSRPIRFSTFPDPRLAGGATFRFLVSSCITPNFPYRGPLYRKAIHGFDLLANSLHPAVTSARRKNIDPQQKIPVDFLLFLGDFIYADVPIYIGDEKEAYRRLYRRNYQSPSFRKIYEHIPIFHTYDDHEIINNYMGEHNDSKPPYPNAADAFKLYNADANYDSMHEGQFYYEFRRGDVAFFVMDTRRYRSRIEDLSTRSMLGEEQLSAVLAWLSQVNNTATFKFVVSSVPFTTLWSHDAQIDSWAGFPKERGLLLDAFHTVPNVVILSGDRHEFAAIAFNGERAESHTVYEFSTSPLSMFYIPFVRTLALRSQDNVTRTKAEVLSTEDGPEVEESIEQLPKEEVLKYLPIGNFKWSDIRVDTTNASKPLIHLTTFIDGSSAYNLTIEGSPLGKEPSVLVGFSVPDTLRELFYKFGFMSNRWI